MYLLKDGRAAYLEFLRNLTPQTIILTFALVAGYGLKPTCCYPENAKQTAIFFYLLGIWGLAFFANCSLFFERYLASVGHINRAGRLLKKRGVVGFRNLRLVMCHTWRKERIVFIEVIVVLLILEVGLLLVVLSAVGPATTFINNMHGVHHR
jgi:hypothetical protein